MRRALLLLSLVATAVGGLITGGDHNGPTTLVVAEGAAPSAAEVTEPPSTTVAPTTTTEAPTTTTIVVDVAPAVEEPEPEETTTTTRPKQAVRVPTYSSMEPCGGDLPPCEVKRRESGGNYRAINWTGCGGRGCFGAWQFDPRTWSGMGYAGRPDQADPEVQDEAARRLWDGGKGCRAWSGPNWNGCQFLES